MRKKLQKSIPLDSSVYQYVLLLSLLSIVPIGGIVLTIILEMETIIKALIIADLLILFTATIYFYNPLPFLLTRVTIVGHSIRLERWKKVFEYRLVDVEEIAIVSISKSARVFKENHQIMKAQKLHFCISKHRGFFQGIDGKIVKMRKEYLINTEQCLIPIIDLDYFKPFLSSYNKEIVNLEKYKTLLMDNEYSYLQNLMEKEST